MLNIRRNAPRLTRFITEHRARPRDHGRFRDRLHHLRTGSIPRPWPSSPRRAASSGPTSAPAPKSPWVTLFIDHPAVNLRMWLWMTYKWGLEGILVWRADYWNSPTLFPPGVLQNPWQDPMSYTVGYGVPYGTR
ncbi:MAG: hypothetical protein M0C28_35510 [Candidatus Moduliflexus flocculans]|nr:hypothetical protein [Candidatus Moduliflexus flocculans]